MDEFESVYLQNESVDDPIHSYSMDRLKIGEVFQIRQNHFVFACIHCSKEFHQFTRFTTHVQSHFQAVFQWTNKNSETAAATSAIENDVEWLVSDTSDESNSDGAEVTPHQFECETELHEDEGDVLNETEMEESLESRFKLKHPLIQVKDTDETQKLLPYFSRKYQFKRTHDHQLRCPLCDYMGGNKSAVREHIFTHLDSKLFVCKLCQDEFHRPRHLREHIEHKHCDFTISHEESGRKLKIERMDPMGNLSGSNVIISKKIKLEPHMIRSLEGRSKEDRLRCYICNKSFSKANGIVKHMKVHSQERNHQCFTCGAQFIRSDHLNRHMLCHEEPKFKCDICDLAFRRSDKLLAHRRKHPEPMNFTCENCGLGFMELSSIKTHIGFHCKGKAENKVITTELSITETVEQPTETMEQPAETRTESLAIESHPPEFNSLTKVEGST